MKHILTMAAVISAILFLLPQIVFLITWIVSKIFVFKLAYKPFLWTSVGLVLLVALLVAYGSIFGMNKFQVTNTELAFKDLPEAFDGYRIVQISDVHLENMQGREDMLQKAVEQINALEPDMVCVTGDLTSQTHEEIDAFVGILSGIKAKDGVFSIMGNHDYAPYNREMNAQQKLESARLVAEKQRSLLGWDILLNEHRIIRRGTDSIAVAGVENVSYSFSRELQFGNLQKAVAGLDSVFTVLLTHDPSHWRAEVLPDSRAQLTLSGHTHAAQIKFFGFTPASWVFKESEGLYQEDDRYLYVNIGLGGVVPFRLGATPEISSIVLRRTIEN